MHFFFHQNLLGFEARSFEPQISASESRPGQHKINVTFFLGGDSMAMCGRNMKKYSDILRNMQSIESSNHQILKFYGLVECCRDPRPCFLDQIV